MLVFLKNCNFDICYNLSINSKLIKELNDTEITYASIEIPINENNILLELTPIYNIKKTFANRFKNFIGELIGLFVWCFYVLGDTKEKTISDFSDYMQLYSKKTLELSINKNSEIFFYFKRSKIAKKENLYKITPTIEKFTNLKILKNEENVVYNNKYINKKFSSYLLFYSSFFIPLLVMLLIGAIDCVIKSNLILLFLMLVLFCGFLIFYLFTVFRIVKIFKSYKNMSVGY